MSTASTRRTPSVGTAQRSLPLRLLAALSLGISSYVHVDLAEGPLFAAGQITMAGLFIGHAVAAAIVGLWVLVRHSRLAWLAVGVVGLVSVLALVVTVYVSVPSIGPLPPVYEPIWYPEKVVAAVTGALPALAALVALAAPRRR
jgi:hypothetical protein